MNPPVFLHLNYTILGWMASLTQWTWVWVNSRSWWWTGRSGVLQSIGSQRDTTEWLNWTELNWANGCDDHNLYFARDIVVFIFLSFRHNTKVNFLTYHHITVLRVFWIWLPTCLYQCVVYLNIFYVTTWLLFISLWGLLSAFLMEQV